MEGWDYRSLESRATVQSYGIQLNLNVLPLLGAGRQGRWRLEISPRVAAVGTKARLYERATGRRVKGLPARWHMGAGFRLQGSCAVAGRLRLGVYTGMTFLTGKGLDGIPRHAHSSNYLWESGVRLSFHFGKAKPEATQPAYVPPAVPVQPEPQPQPAEEKPAPVIAEQPKQEPALPKAQQKQATFPTIYFDFNSSAVRPSERGKAEAMASMMASDPAMRVRLTGWCEDARGKLTALGFPCPSLGDPTRLCIRTDGMGLTGWEALHQLAELGVDMEMGDARGVVAIGSVYDRAEDFAALTSAFARLRPGRGKAPAFPKPAYGVRALRPRAAALGKTRLVPLKEAAGEIAARAVGAYPPGCATAAPGERLTEACVEFLLASRAAGATLFGAEGGLVEVVDANEGANGDV